jgi:hypothetical protein
MIGQSPVTAFYRQRLLRIALVVLIAALLPPFAPVNANHQPSVALEIYMTREFFVLRVTADYPVDAGSIYLSTVDEDGQVDPHPFTEYMPVLQQSDSIAYPGNCYAIRVFGSLSPLPLVCNNGPVPTIQEINNFEKFWYDNTFNQYQAIGISFPDGQSTSCPAREGSCTIEVAPPAATPTPASNTPCTVSTTLRDTTQIRVGPGTDRGVFGFLPVNTPYTVRGYHIDFAGARWFNIDWPDVSENQQDRRWITESQVQVDGNCATLPEIEDSEFVSGCREELRGELATLTQLTAGTEARIQQDTIPLNSGKYENTDQAITTLTNGEIVTLRRGPYCFNGDLDRVYWYVTAPDGVTAGYLYEFVSRGAVRYLVSAVDPTPSPPPDTATPPPTNAPTITPMLIPTATATPPPSPTPTARTDGPCAVYAPDQEIEVRLGPGTYRGSFGTLRRGSGHEAGTHAPVIGQTVARDQSSWWQITLPPLQENNPGSPQPLWVLKSDVQTVGACFSVPTVAAPPFQPDERCVMASAHTMDDLVRVIAPNGTRPSPEPIRNGLLTEFPNTPGLITGEQLKLLIGPFCRVNEDGSVPYVWWQIRRSNDTFWFFPEYLESGYRRFIESVPA